MKKYALLAGLVSLGALAHAQLSGNLYLAQADDAAIGIVDQEFPDFADFSTGAGNVVTFNTAVQLTDVQTRLLDSGSWISNKISQGRLTISKFGGTPSTEHAPGGASSGGDIVYDGVLNTAISNLSGSLFNFTGDASGVPVIGAGTYFVTFTGMAEFGTNGQAFHMASSDTSMDSWARNTGAGFGFPAGGDWFKTSSLPDWSTVKQISLGINGRESVPEPATMAILGAGAAFLARRRRK